MFTLLTLNHYLRHPVYLERVNIIWTQLLTLLDIPECSDHLESGVTGHVAPDDIGGTGVVHTGYCGVQSNSTSWLYITGVGTEYIL